MTTFILHGGMLSYEHPDNDSFFRECVKKLADGDFVLFVAFAREENEQREVYEKQKQLLARQTDAAIDVVFAELATLREQVTQANVVFVTGGDMERLKRDLATVPEFRELLTGKVYAGSSAGACVACAYYFDCVSSVRKGLAWLPIRVLVHDGNPDFAATEGAVEQLAQHPRELELVRVPECGWRVFQKEE